MTPRDVDLAPPPDVQPAPDETDIRLRFVSTLGNVDYAAVAVRAWCELGNVPAEVAWQVELVVVEAITNIVVHAYGNRPNQPIWLRWLRRKDKLTIEIRDRGRPLTVMPDGELPDPEADAGRGWPIIHACADTVKYRRAGRDNVLTLGKSLKPT